MIFYENWSFSFVAVATESFHRFIMGKIENGIY